MTAVKTLFVGIGSPHGDDQVGWLIIDELRKFANSLACRQAQTPLELLDWVDGLDELVVCDAMSSDQPAGSTRCWDWPTPAIGGVRFRGTHDLSLQSTLELAATLGRLPAKVRIWGVQIGAAAPHAVVSPAIAGCVPRIAKRIYEDSRDA